MQNQRGQVSSLFIGPQRFLTDIFITCSSSGYRVITDEEIIRLWNEPGLGELEKEELERQQKERDTAESSADKAEIQADKDHLQRAEELRAIAIEE